MDGESINFLAAPAAFLLGLVCGSLAFRKAGFGWAKTLFGTLTLAVAGLAVAGIVVSIQKKAGVPELPLAWVSVVLAVVAAWRISKVQAPD
ncbi:hypothetical protein [Magnetospirillum moscoviense]|uniref:Uncharacterized protein n=1 Tax=Magnetospirillum moscoviense TaxID=1437059 RepID=A0A178MMR1_9PROT|nr:hypothetical protein [Magnetospirillum moscoviense]MBF0325085.1 hypothetical protein [Alphaproteobacteria bacterium]OAN50060.1 hypothetical protein A6A05_02285 [Magnetospirillum moscoviense]